MGQTSGNDLIVPPGTRTPRNRCEYSRAKTRRVRCSCRYARWCIERRKKRAREIIDHLDGRIAQSSVVLEMAADKNELRTEFARPPSRHAAADPEGPGFVGSGKHNPAANGDRPATLGRLEQLLDRGVEGVQVRMEDRRYPFHPDSSISHAFANSRFLCYQVLRDRT